MSASARTSGEETIRPDEMEKLVKKLARDPKIVIL
jgi:hypothetical protein